MSVQLFESGETFFWRAFRSERAEAGFGIEFGDADGGEFLDQLVDADLAVLGELAEAGVFVVGEANGEGAHDGMSLENWRGVWIFRLGKRSWPWARSLVLLVTMVSALPARASSMRWLSASSGRFGRHRK